VAVIRSRRPIAERFWEKVNRRGPGECWPWLGAQSNGYGQMRGHDQAAWAHRVAYELVRGPIPLGLTIDHLCRNRLCVNPSHMEAVTNQENILRGIGFAAENARKTKCPRGHAYDLIGLQPGFRGKGFQNMRGCRTCRNERVKAYYHAKQAAKRAAK
jgi:hypothetical protein